MDGWRFDLYSSGMTDCITDLNINWVFRALIGEEGQTSFPTTRVSLEGEGSRNIKDRVGS